MSAKKKKKKKTLISACKKHKIKKKKKKEEKKIIRQNCLFLFIKGLLNHENFIFILKPQEFICYQTLTKWEMLKRRLSSPCHPLFLKKIDFYQFFIIKM
jgi:hypothetical protein